MHIVSVIPTENVVRGAHEHLRVAFVFRMRYMHIDAHVKICAMANHKTPNPTQRQEVGCLSREGISWNGETRSLLKIVMYKYKFKDFNA